MWQASHRWCRSEGFWDSGCAGGRVGPEGPLGGFWEAGLHRLCWRCVTEALVGWGCEEGFEACLRGRLRCCHVAAKQSLRRKNEIWMSGGGLAVCHTKAPQLVTAHVGGLLCGGQVSSCWLRTRRLYPSPCPPYQARRKPWRQSQHRRPGTSSPGRHGWPAHSLCYCPWAQPWGSFLAEGVVGHWWKTPPRYQRLRPTWAPQGQAEAAAVWPLSGRPQTLSVSGRRGPPGLPHGAAGRYQTSGDTYQSRKETGGWRCWLREGEKKYIKHQPKILVASQPALCTAALVLLWFYYYCCFLQSENNSQRKKHGKQLATRKNSKLECSDSVGGKNTRGSGLPTLLRKKNTWRYLTGNKRENNRLTYHPLRQTSATTTWLTQESSLSAGRDTILTELPITFSVETSGVPLSAGTAGDRGAIASLLHCSVQWWQIHLQRASSSCCLITATEFKLQLVKQDKPKNINH